VFNSNPTWPSFYFHQELAGDEFVIEGLRWLMAAVNEQGGQGTVVAPSRRHFDDDPLRLAHGAFRCETTRTLQKTGLVEGPLLAVWPRDQTLNLIEEWHHPSALCVVPWQLAHIEKWRLARRPIDLLGRVEQVEAPAITDPVVAAAMRDVSTFINVNNELVQDEDKACAVDALRKLSAGGHDFDPAELEIWALADGWGSAGASRLRDFAAGVGERRSIRTRGFAWPADALERWRREATEGESA
jgi:hypothetical protein